ncbi:MAG: 30S ribosomal protein S17 [bacterium]
MSEIKDNKKRKIFSGNVVGDKMDKTIVVKVDNVKMNSKYKKQYMVSKKFKVHDAANKYKIDDKVKFVECRPISKDKKWRVL